MLKNYFIAAIRAIRRSPWEAVLKIFAIAAGVCTSVLHIAYWYSGDFSNLPDLITGLVILLMTSVLLIQFYGQPQERKEYRLRIVLGDEDLLMRGRKISEAGVIILGGVILGLVLVDFTLNYLAEINLQLSKVEYITSILLLGFAHYTLFLFTVWFGSAIVIKNDSENFSRFCKILAGVYIFLTSLFSILWSLGSNEEFGFLNIQLFDIMALSVFSFTSWNRLAQYIVDSKNRIISIMKHQRTGELRVFVYWIIQLGPAAFISIGLALLLGNIYLFLAMSYHDEALNALITVCWAIFVFIIIILGLAQPLIKGFKEDSRRSLH